MDAIATLVNEHRLIERACDALVAFANQSRHEEADGRAELARFISFIRGFADGCHHSKEEKILFQAMVVAGLVRHGGPVAVLLLEHDDVRRHVAVLQDFAAQQRLWNPDDRHRLEQGVSAYAELLREHIRNEDMILFPMAEQQLPPQVRAQVESACARFDAEQAAATERLRVLCEDLVSRYVDARLVPIW